MVNDKHMQGLRAISEGQTAGKENVKIDLVAEALALAGTIRLRVTGASMLPAIWPGDVLTVRRLESEELQAGDIAVLRREGRLITHRVIHKDKQAVVVQGDAKLRADAPFRREDVFGSVVAVHRDRKEVALARKTAARAVVGCALGSSQLLTRLAVRLHAVNSWWAARSSRVGGSLWADGAA
jgi:signal peptidase I